MGNVSINAAIDTGKYQDISVEEVEDHIDGGDLIPYLRERLEGDFDLSFVNGSTSYLNRRALGRQQPVEAHPDRDTH